MSRETEDRGLKIVRMQWKKLTEGERETAAITRYSKEKLRISAEKAGPFVTSDNGDKGSNEGG
jgi:hypothetical protein